MFEVELKYRINGNDSDIIKILNNKTEGIIEVYEDVYFTHPEVIPLQSNKELRVRRINSDTKNRSILTYKNEIIDEESGSKSEFEVLIDNSDNAIKLIKAMGFIVEIAFSKKCINWLLTNVFNGNDMLVSYVKVSEINGTFLEIEITINNSDEVESALNAVKEFSRQLGLKDDDIEKGLYTDAVRTYRKNAEKN